MNLKLIITARKILSYRIFTITQILLIIHVQWYFKLSFKSCLHVDSIFGYTEVDFVLYRLNAVFPQTDAIFSV